MLWAALIVLPYAVIILFGWISLARATRERQQDKLPVIESALPYVTVIVAARNEENNLPGLIDSLVAQDYPGSKTTIIIADNGSVDSTPQIIRDAAALHSNITVSTTPYGNKKEAIADALEMARGELILTTDADCELQRGWISSFVASRIDTGADLIIGSVAPVVPGNIIGKLLALEFASLQALTAGMAAGGIPVMCNGASMGFSKVIAEGYRSFIRTGIPSGDDMFMLQQVKRKGGLVRWNASPSGEAATVLPDTIRSFIRQRARWASKGISYTDPAIIITGISTLLSNIALATAMALGIISPVYLPLLLTIYLGRSVPEFLLLLRYLGIRGERSLILWYFPLSLIYPYYVITAVIIAGFYRTIPSKTGRWNHDAGRV